MGHISMHDSFHFAECGHNSNPDVDKIPDAVPRGKFAAVQCTDPNILTFDLETTGLGTCIGKGIEIF